MNNSKWTQRRLRETAELRAKRRVDSNILTGLSGLRSQQGVTPNMISRFHLTLPLLLLFPPLQGLEIHDPEEVEYVHSNISTAAGGSVSLPCGSAKPNIFIWGFTKAGTENNVALAYDYGQGTMVQSQASALGHVQVPANSSSLVIEDLSTEAGGTYTCQALYDTDGGAHVTFYFTLLDVEDE